MNHEIGKIFEVEIKGKIVELEVEESQSLKCDNCYFFDPETCYPCNRYRDELGECAGEEREDGKSVIFTVAK